MFLHSSAVIVQYKEKKNPNYNNEEDSPRLSLLYLDFRRRWGHSFLVPPMYGTEVLPTGEMCCSIFHIGRARCILVEWIITTKTKIKFILNNFNFKCFSYLCFFFKILFLWLHSHPRRQQIRLSSRQSLGAVGSLAITALLFSLLTFITEQDTRTFFVFGRPKISAPLFNGSNSSSRQVLHVPKNNIYRKSCVIWIDVYRSCSSNFFNLILLFSN